MQFDHEIDRKSTRLNSSHLRISYAVFCLKKKKTYARQRQSQQAPTRRTPRGALSQRRSLPHARRPHRIPPLPTVSASTVDLFFFKVAAAPPVYPPFPPPPFAP